jgi:hypothetical protein
MTIDGGHGTGFENASPTSNSGSEIVALAQHATSFGIDVYDPLLDRSSAFQSHTVSRKEPSPLGKPHLLQIQNSNPASVADQRTTCVADQVLPSEQKLCLERQKLTRHSPILGEIDAIVAPDVDCDVGSVNAPVKVNLLKDDVMRAEARDDLLELEAREVFSQPQQLSVGAQKRLSDVSRPAFAPR